MSGEDLPGSFGPFRLEARASGIGILWFDDPARKVNLLDSASLAALRRALDRLKRRDATFPRALILTSGKEGQFIAGADVAEFDRVESPADAEARVKEAQLLFEEWSQLPFPTVAAINGACLGGGTELALAMRHRIAADSREVTIGLPEVKLGILPGFGGTTRLPRLVGLVPSLGLLLTGRTLDPRRAKRMGLVDDVLPAARFVDRAVTWTESLLAAPHTPRRAGPSPVHRVFQTVPPFRGYALGQARQTVMRETKGHYPAPLEILRVVSESWGKPVPEALKIERKAVAKLLFTPASQHLRRLFALTERAKRVPPADRARRVGYAGVLGAGTMGGEIAYLMSMRNVRVRLRDIKPEPILKSLAHARSLFLREVERRRMTPAEMEHATGRIEPTVDLAGFRRVDLILEAVVEDLNIKQTLFRELEEQVDPTCVFATNTSSLSVAAMARGLAHPERVVGMHFFNPATRMPLVEVIRTDRTDPAALDTVIALTRRLKKTPVIVRDEPGFLVNRILMPYLAEAVGFVERGQSVPAIDKALRDFGMPLGPLELLDEIGMDVARKVAHVLVEAFGARIPSLSLIDRMVSEGALGKKANLGFYRYERGVRGGVNPSIASLATSAEVVPPSEIADRLVDAMVNEAALALDDRVVDDPNDVDLAMILGTGFPPFRGGLLRHADSVGVGMIVERLARRQQAGAPYGPSGRLQRMALAGERFHERTSGDRTTGPPPSEAAALSRR